MTHSSALRIAVAGGTGTVGRHVVEVAAQRAHDVVVLSRGLGCDLMSADGLEERLAGVDVVVDVTSRRTYNARAARRFFGVVTANLLAAECAVGVTHHLALSVVGAERSPYGYYAGKALQEELVTESRVPWTLQRTTQFHELAEEVQDSIVLGPIEIVPRMLLQPIAAREAATRLVDLAEIGPSGRVRDLTGPRPELLGSMVRRYERAVGRHRLVAAVPLPGRRGQAMRRGDLLPGSHAEWGAQTFDDWVRALREQRHHASGRS